LTIIVNFFTLNCQFIDQSNLDAITPKPLERKQSTMRFEFATATRIIFGPGTLKDIGVPAAEMGHHGFVITGRNSERAMPLEKQLKKQGVLLSRFSIPEEPTTDLALAAVEKARRDGCDFVIGIGGGSVLDTGKIVAALLTNSGELMEYLEVIGGSQPLNRRSAPYIAIPTTSGTGAEVTRNAVLDSPRHRIKVSMRSPFMLPRLALIDPELTYSMPPSITATTGLDAFTQLLEAFVSSQANPLTNCICRQGLKRAARALKMAYQNGKDAPAREDMCLASLFSGLALANAKLGAVHGFAGALGGMYNAPHGTLCAALLPHVMEANISALHSRASDAPALGRYNEVARIVTGEPGALADQGITWVKELCLQLQIPTLAAYGLEKADFPAAVTKSQNASSMKGNPITLTKQELLEILEKAF
jgi:alcohol dehydrogenase class IV